MTKRRHDSGLRLLAYARVSAVRGREGPGFISEGDQFARCRSYADAYGHTIVAEGSDLDVSGDVMSRPKFDRFLEMVARGEADGIIVAKLDRFARSNVGALEAVESIEKAGGTLISVAEQLDASTGAGRFLRTILFAAAQWERERIGESWLTARTKAVERGIHVAPHVPPGYVRGPKATKEGEPDRRLTPHPVHAETIREAFRMAGDGARNTEIADYLNERSLPTVSVKKGEKATHWQSFRIPRLLANRAYLGEARSGDGVPVNEEAHEAIVDEETWLLAQHRNSNVQELRKPNQRAKTPPSVLSGIVRCAGCSFAMKPQESGKTSPALYRCVKTSVHGRCPSPSVIAKARLEDYVIAEFLEQADAFFVASSADEGDDGRRALIVEADAAERSYRNALTNVELRRRIGDTDHDAMIASLHEGWLVAVAELEKAQVPPTAAPLSPEGISLGGLVERLRAAEGQDATERRKSNEELRRLLSSGIEAVFVRPASSKARNVPVGDRVRIIWHGSETLELPKRGLRFEPRAYVW